MTIQIDQHLENTINNKVMSGLYPSANVVIKEALDLLEEKDNFKKYVNKSIEEAEASIANGEIIDDAQLEIFIENLFNSK